MKAETVYVKTAALALAGGVLCLCMLGAGCATEQAFALDTANPTIRYSTQGFLIGDRFVDPKKIPGILESQGVPRERTIHIQIDEEAERSLATPRSFMRFLASRGYTRSVIATKQHNGGFSQFLEISVRRDGVWAGEERVAPASVPARLKARGVPTSSLIVVFLEDGLIERLLAVEHEGIVLLQEPDNAGLLHGLLNTSRSARADDTGTQNIVSCSLIQQTNVLIHSYKSPELKTFFLAIASSAEQAFTRIRVQRYELFMK